MEASGDDGHIVVLNGVHYNYVSHDYDVIITDPNYRYGGVSPSSNSVGFDNVLGSDVMLGYSIAYDDNVVQITGATEAIYEFGYTRQDAEYDD